MKENIRQKEKLAKNLGCKMGIIKSNYHSWWNLCRNFHTDRGSSCCKAVYAFICGAFIYREFNIKEMFATIGNACNTTGTTMVIIGCATAFTKILTIEKIPGAITNGIINFTDNKILILLLINVLLLIVGCFMDTTPAMMVLAPILLPIAAQFGVDPIHFGIVMVVNLAIGFITPPLGINLFVASRVGRSDLETVCSGIIKIYSGNGCGFITDYIYPGNQYDASEYIHEVMRKDSSYGIFDLTGKKAIVTGGSRGLGHGMAEGLMEAGCEVVIIGTREKVLKTVRLNLIKKDSSVREYRQIWEMK